MLDAMFDSPAIVQSAMALMGLTAARLDYCRETDMLLLSLAIHGQIHHIRLPLSVTMTRQEICDLLFPELRDQTETPIAASGP